MFIDSERDGASLGGRLERGRRRGRTGLWKELASPVKECWPPSVRLLLSWEEEDGMGGGELKRCRVLSQKLCSFYPTSFKHALACYKFLIRFQGYEESGSDGFCHLSCCFYRGRESWISLVPHFTDALMVLFLRVGDGDPHIQMLWTASSNNVLPP